MVGRLGDPAADLGDESGDGGDDAGAVRTSQGQDEGSGGVAVGHPYQCAKLEE